ncbi:uncharacterized protein L201_002686 [Kwoniella dendrophila CBS 6074]|uniref:U6 snRNA phosphodiesterase 1 n=1 Tax=Kwoniella dendrophila CBS 6074 TaxID=1295534 RepID=A0AAX4JR01_9TREE
MPLVDYDSSSSEDELQVSRNGGSRRRTTLKSVDVAQAIQRPAKRQKTLPSLPDTFESGPKDDSSLHQGRKRTRRYVDGEYNAHVYLSLDLPTSMRRVSEDILSELQDEIPGHKIHSLLSNLHISLTHPLPLRRHQIESFRNQLSNCLRSQSSNFKLSFASDLKVYYNRSQNNDAEEGSGGRAFLALRVGAGAKELNEILDKIIHPLLGVIHLPTYHENPEFHTSFGWTLLDPSTVSTSIGQKESKVELPLNKEIQEEDTLESPVKGSKLARPFSDDLLERINNKFAKDIIKKQPKGGWEIDTVNFKVAKEIHILKLGNQL